MSSRKKTTTAIPAKVESVLDAGLLDLLLKGEFLSEDVLLMLDEQAEGSESAFEKLLLDEGYLIDEQLGQLKSQIRHWDFVNLEKEFIDKSTLTILPRIFAEAQRAVSFKKNGEDLSVAMSQPDASPILRLLRKKFGPEVHFYYATNIALNAILDRYDAQFEDQCRAILADHRQSSHAKEGDELDDSVIRLVDTIVLHGVRQNASDIHIEPNRLDTVVRERIDGVLQKTVRYTKEVHSLAVLRIKVLANLATDEHTAPQDGKFTFETPGGKRVDVRVSILATTHGEKVVLRLLVSQDQPMTLSSLGLLPKDEEIFSKEIGRSWGMVLVTGPTGSGKTTSLYAGMRRIISDEINIATIEDPVEYDLTGTNQVQVNEAAGLTFATGLRSLVRQDPDVMLVGEIRDTETASIAVNAAMTGHLVFSTLHTNDAATAIPRLLDMGVEPFLISSTLNAVVAQRLVRNICPHCRQSKEVTTKELKQSIPENILKKLAGRKKKVRMYEGAGCDFCSNQGYHGRSGIFEVLQISDHIQQLIMAHENADTILEAAIEEGMHTMLDDGIQKVLEGVTSIKEVLRVIRS